MDTLMDIKTTELRPGTMLRNGSYRIISVLGRGGFGITYLAEQMLMSRKVCIKEFFPKDFYCRNVDTQAVGPVAENFRAMMDGVKAKFLKEARAIARLTHPNIVSVFDLFEENNTAYYVMEYIEGESLYDVVRLGGALGEATARRYIGQVADALGYIHEHNLLHLDIKPHNIMLSQKDDRAILIDFGLSKHYDEESGSETTNSLGGHSDGYAPTEQYVRGGVSEFTPETDIYSLGATLYALVEGHRPPSANEIDANGMPSMSAHLSASLCAAVETAMQYRRKDRPRDVAEFLRILNADIEPTPVMYGTRYPDDVATHIITGGNENPKRRGGKLWIIILVLLLLVGGAVAAYFVFMKPAAEPDVETVQYIGPVDEQESVETDDVFVELAEPEEIAEPEMNEESVENDGSEADGPETKVHTPTEDRTPETVPQAKSEPTNKKSSATNKQQPPAPTKTSAAGTPAATTPVTPAQSPDAPQSAATEAPEPVQSPEDIEAARIERMVAEGLGRDGVYRVGDYYNVGGKEGVVIEVRDGGRHGKIVSLREVTRRGWCTPAYYANARALGASDIKSGKRNTELCEAAGITNFPAASWCLDMGDGWYLPALNELTLIYNVRSKINPTLTSNGGNKISSHWHISSTEYDGAEDGERQTAAYAVWSVRMLNGQKSANQKSGTDCSVRAIATF